MGNNNITNLIQKIKITEDWIFLYHDEEGNKVFKNSINQLAEQYIVPFDNNLNIEQELEIYQYRKNQNFSLVKIYGVNINETNDLFCANQKTSRILTQKIQNRLSAIPQLNFYQALYTLVECLKGYKEIYRRNGKTQINDNMIAINSERFVRVWINETFWKNYSQHSRNLERENNQYNLDYENKNSEQNFVLKIFQIIEKHCQNGSFPTEFKKGYNLIASNSLLNFKNAQIFLYNYINKNNVKLPDRLSLKCAYQSRTNQKNQLIVSYQPHKQIIQNKLINNQVIPQSMSISPKIDTSTYHNSINKQLKGIKPIKLNLINPKFSLQHSKNNYSDMLEQKLMGKQTISKYELIGLTNNNLTQQTQNMKQLRGFDKKMKKIISIDENLQTNDNHIDIKTSNKSKFHQRVQTSINNSNSNIMNSNLKLQNQSHKQTDSKKHTPVPYQINPGDEITLNYANYNQQNYKFDTVAWFNTLNKL